VKKLCITDKYWDLFLSFDWVVWLQHR